MPDEYRNKPGTKPRGVSNRNRALEWILANASRDGVFYFADDDNTYDLRIFTEARLHASISLVLERKVTCHLLDKEDEDCIGFPGGIHRQVRAVGAHRERRREGHRLLRSLSQQEVRCRHVRLRRRRQSLQRGGLVT